jgi:hypothetical protein
MYAVCDLRDRDNQVLATVEYDQAFLRGNEREDRRFGVRSLNGAPERRRYRARHVRLVDNRTEIDKENVFLPVFLPHLVGDSDRNTGLPDPASTYNADETPLLETLFDGGDSFFSSDEDCQSRGKFMAHARPRRCNRHRDRNPCHSGNRGYEAVALSCDIHDKPVAALSIRQSPSQDRKLRSQIGLFDDYVPPDKLHEFAAADNFTGPLDQTNQDVQGAGTEPNVFGTPCQDSLMNVQLERPEMYDAALVGVHHFAQTLCIDLQLLT